MSHEYISTVTITIVILIIIFMIEIMLVAQTCPTDECGDIVIFIILKIFFMIIMIEILFRRVPPMSAGRPWPEWILLWRRLLLSSLGFP